MGRKSADPWKAIRLPNAGSELQTPASLKLDLHFEGIRVWQRWDYERFIRLATFLKLTPGELASTACVPHRALAALEKRNRLYNGGSPDRAAALVLTLLEHHVASAYTKDTVANAFPDLTQVAPSSDESPGDT